jgi:hypothetical protein
MSTVMIKCPNTGDFIATGIETDPESFRNLPDVLAHSRCPLCGLEHAWWKREAWLDGTSEAEVDEPTGDLRELRSA